ncbi:NAD-dependent epimerase/dehydratase family protein [Reichenbachiella agariperforans]|uniref:NAD-dependent epimerase/dehydratase family protein n=1 Tax=Reichenbachiella agariperforans TaxID=156994 RepID=UPI001C0904A6|nr:NAD-dependent epimerase/dehydratase family protein [Reichenbachiella agariperforans]MBU2915892.1 NAD-dependent epimerase/dehydratase family protein [Reichenbachiella agariperforans]
MNHILVIGACGQLGAELTVQLRQIYGAENVIAADKREPVAALQDGIFEVLDVMDINRVKEVLKKYQITEVYHLVALLSATAEASPRFAWELNMNSLVNLLDLAKEGHFKRLYWPSSIAVFGPNTPKVNTPQQTFMDPNTIYGISKLAGERWCDYYFEKHHVDVRSLRYPGLIGYKSLPGGGTTDYAVDIYHKAKAMQDFSCFLKENTRLPMMYMDDAVRATIDIMNAPAEQITIRSSYNISAMSFTPKEIYEEIKKRYPNFKISYAPDFRQGIAESWSESIDDSTAQRDWGWKPEFDLPKMTEVILENL